MEFKTFNSCVGRELRVRSVNGEPSRVVEGYAIVFGERSVSLGSDDRGRPVFEVIAPEAVTRELLDRCDIRLTLFHNRDLILARTVDGDQRTLHYEVDERGVKFWAEMPQTADGDKALELVRRQDIDGCSFMFSTCYCDGECVTREVSDGAVVFTVHRIDAIYDFTLTPDPAYPETEVAARDINGSIPTVDNREQLNEMYKLINKKFL